MNKVELKSEKNQNEKSLAKVNPHDAGLDLHKEMIWGCVATGAVSDSPVQTFGTYTAELSRLVKWLQDSVVETVAMESTGAYWIPGYDTLEMGIKNLLPSILSPGQSPEVLRTDSHALRGGPEIRKQKHKN
jgi:hypothetical protein